MKANTKEDAKGLVFSIQSYSVHDGPGTRTTIFFSGCPLSCEWCCNPEGLFHKPIMLHSKVKCVQCGECLHLCPHSAVKIIDGKIMHNRDICNNCHTMNCIEACLHEGKSISGEYYTVDKLMQRLDRERPYWGDHGGVTLSGGEPLLQKEFVLPLLKECKNRYIHTCIETTGNVASGYWLEVLPYVDWVFMDIKHLDSKKHKKLTGVGNELILKNIKLLADYKDWEGIIVTRIPIIPNFNDDEENIKKTAKLISQLNLEVINILPFHRLAESKYRQLDQVYKFEQRESSSKEYLKHLKSIIEEEGLLCYIGYDTPF